MQEFDTVIDTRTERTGTIVDDGRWPQTVAGEAVRLVRMHDTDGLIYVPVAALRRA